MKIKHAIAVMTTMFISHLSTADTISTSDNTSINNTIETTAVTNIPLYDKHSVVLLDSKSLCRFISRVEKPATDKVVQNPITGEQPHWSLYIKEEWCQKKMGVQEQVLDFHPQYIVLTTDLPKGAVIRFQK